MKLNEFQKYKSFLGKQIDDIYILAYHENFFHEIILCTGEQTFSIQNDLFEPSYSIETKIKNIKLDEIKIDQEARVIHKLITNNDSEPNEYHRISKRDDLYQIINEVILDINVYHLMSGEYRGDNFESYSLVIKNIEFSFNDLFFYIVIEDLFTGLNFVISKDKLYFENYEVYSLVNDL